MQTFLFYILHCTLNCKYCKPYTVQFYSVMNTELLWLYTANCTLNMYDCTIYTGHWTVISVPFTMNRFTTLYYTLICNDCTLYSVHWTVMISTVHYTLQCNNGSPYTEHWIEIIVLSTIMIVHCILLTLMWLLHTVQCTRNCRYYTLYTANYNLIIANCTMHT